MMLHQSVLLNECIEGLNIQPNGIYIDATFGRGGHSLAVLERLGDLGRLIVIDKDEAAIEEANRLFATDSRCQPYHDSFAHIKMIAEKEEIIGKTAGILMDLGVSSPQLDTAERGFSFLREGPLDMRMDQRGTLDAATWINSAREEEIARILYVYGEERYSRRIAKKIVEERSINPITTTLQLAQLIAKAHPAWDKHKHPATKSFQAIRLLINQELEDLQHALNDAVDILGPKGRLVVLSFHSLEDRIVKQFLKKQSEGLPLPSHIPVRAKEQQVSMRRIGKAIRPSDSEIRLNSRARSATLRIGEKI
jgi:16S rRNA (cytosine1402-N4)-methyltransferase